MSTDERRESDREPCPPGHKVIYTPYITRNGKRIEHPDWPPGVFRFTVPKEDSERDEDA